MKPLKLKTFEEFAEFYGVLCDAFYRYDKDVPKDDPFSHASSVSRAVANAITNRMIDDGYLELPQ